MNVNQIIELMTHLTSSNILNEILIHLLNSIQLNVELLKIELTVKGLNVKQLKVESRKHQVLDELQMN
jgi:hypothetical protein